MTDDLTIMQTVNKLRRDMPRNSMVMRVCDELAARMMVQDTKTEKRVVAVKDALRFDKVAYQKEYMRSYRKRRKK